MNLRVQIIDHRDTRSANIAGRVLAFLQHNQMDGRLSRLSYDVARFASRTDSETGAPAVPVDAMLSLLHYDDETMSLVERLARLADAAATQTHLTVVYSGDEITKATRNALKASAGARMRLSVCEDLVYGDEIGAQSGLDQPPVERFLVELLGLPEDALTVPGVLGSPGLTPDAAANVRHRLINACSPMREKINQSLDRGNLAPDFDDLWEHSQKDFGKITQPLPKRVEEQWRAVQSLLSDLSNDVEVRNKRLTAALLVISDIENYAASIGRQATKRDQVAATIQESSEGRRLKILWIEDKPQWHLAYKAVLEECFIDVEYVQSVIEWLKKNDNIAKYDSILLDIALQDQGRAIADALAEREPSLSTEITDDNAGLGILQLFRSTGDCPPVFMLTAWKSTNVVQACTRFGARRYFVKGDTDVVDLITAIHSEAGPRAEHRRIIAKPQNPKLLVGGVTDPLIGVFTELEMIARSKVTVHGSGLVCTGN